MESNGTINENSEVKPAAPAAPELAIGTNPPPIYMSTSIKRSTLSAMLAIVDSAIERRPSFPAAATVRVDANGAARLYGWIGSTCRAGGKIGGSAAIDLVLPCETTVDGDGCYVSAHEFRQIVSKSRAKSIDLAVSAGSLAVVSDGARSELRTVNGETMPDPGPMAEHPFRWTTTAGDLARTIGSVAHAISSDETRQHLNSCLVELDGCNLRAVATDGHRMAVRTCTVDAEGTDRVAVRSILVPRRVVDVLVRLIGKCKPSDPCEVKIGINGGCDDRQAYEFSTPIGAVRGIAVDASFPPWRQVIPRDSRPTVKVAPLELARSCRALPTADKSPSSAWSFPTGRIHLDARHPDMKCSIDVPATIAGEVWTVDGEEKRAADLVIGFNPSYMAESCESFAATGAESIDLLFGGYLDGAIVRNPAQPEDLDVVMPVRI
jgi:DNA polymerase-3 subunit beta